MTNSLLGYAAFKQIVEFRSLFRYLYLFPMGYQTLGTIGPSTTHTTDVPSQRKRATGRDLTQALSDFPECNWIRALSESQGTNSLGYDSA